MFLSFPPFNFIISSFACSSSSFGSESERPQIKLFQSHLHQKLSAQTSGKKKLFPTAMANYYDIDDILTEEELVSVVFQKAVNGVGIDPGSETDCVEPGSKVELPFWLAHELHLRQIATTKLPPCFNQKTRLELGADAACVDLRSRCPYFYEYGCKIAPLVGDRDMGSFLLSAFKNRYQEVLAKAHTAAFPAASKFLNLLTKEETNLYEAAQSSMAAFKKWQIGGPRFLRAAVLGRKRKPID